MNRTAAEVAASAHVQAHALERAGEIEHDRRKVERLFGKDHAESKA
jgi:hypothetical protein